MSLHLHVIHAKDFIRTTPTGYLDFPNLAQVWQLAQTLIDYGAAFQRKMAILIPPDAPGDRARFFEVCAQNRGFEVRAFDDFEQAIYWLAASIEKKEPSEESAYPGAARS